MVKKIKVCPQCKKARLTTAFNVSGWLAPDMYKCNNCSYTGPLYIEVDPKDFELTKDDLSKKETEEEQK